MSCRRYSLTTGSMLTMWCLQTLTLTTINSMDYLPDETQWKRQKQWPNCNRIFQLQQTTTAQRHYQTSSIGSLSSAMVTSNSPVVPVPSLRSCSAGLLFSSIDSDIGSMIDWAVSASAANEQENTSRLCRLHDSGRSELWRYITTAVLCQTISPSTLTTFIATFRYHPL